MTSRPQHKPKTKKPPAPAKKAAAKAGTSAARRSTPAKAKATAPPRPKTVKPEKKPKSQAVAGAGQQRVSEEKPPKEAKASKKERRKRLPKPREPNAANRALQVDAEEEYATLGIGSRVVPPEFAADEERAAAPKVSAGPAGKPDVESQLRALEARLDGLIQRAGRALEETEGEVEAEETAGKVETPSLAGRRAESLNDVPADAEAPTGGAFSNAYYLRQWGRAGLRRREEPVDEFGRDPEYERRLQPITNFLYKRYFRVETQGIANVPSQGRCLVVANHSGTLPLDGAMLKTAMRLEHPTQRDLRWLAEDFIYYLPFVGVMFNRVGAVRACQENAERLLRNESLVAVFPEGVKGIKKLYKDRYRLERFGRGGYIRLCLRTQTPLVPCAIIGGEETNPMLYRVEYLSKIVGLPYLPVTPTFPWLGPLGLVPAPSKWRIMFGEPIAFDDYGPEAADDHVLVGRLSERVQNAIYDMLQTGLRQRRSVWLG